MTTETAEPTLAGLVERYSGVRAMAGDIVKTLQATNTKLDELWHDLVHVAEAHFTLLAEVREAFRPVAGEGPLAESSTPDSIVGYVTGRHALIDGIDALKGMLQSYTDQLERWWDEEGGQPTD